ncbi:MAG: hypothetical protein ACRD0K_19685 [Egibacteraceae bacterium]
MSAQPTAIPARETTTDHGLQLLYQDHLAEDLVEMLERQVDQDDALDVEIVFELAVRALKAEAAARHQQP